MEAEDRKVEGGLAVEDRSASTEDAGIEETIVDFVRGTRRGEARALTTSVGVSQSELSTRLFDKLRAAPVFLSTGVNVLATDSTRSCFRSSPPTRHRPPTAKARRSHPATRRSRR